MAFSSCEFKYIVIISAKCQGMWISRLVELMGITMKLVKVIVNNQSAIMLSKNSGHHNRTKHIDTRYHFIQDYINDESIIIKYLKIEDKLLDI